METNRHQNSRRITTLFAGAFALVSATIGLQSSAEAGDSSFQRSCQSASLGIIPESALFFTACGNGNGGGKNSAVSVDNIHNRNGKLVYN